MDELFQIKKLISELEEKIKELEKENLALRQAILGACDSLIQGNQQMSTSLSAKQAAAYQSSFKPPKWKK
tara:strand:- start:231 stop:440 length:210 start_codon:yes stop_codon:yes gene_type:complete